ncbi:MAG: CotH kinase family protein [Lachnospiraceae bacterium]|nr:CotH kinase family protein [Lachnospiraceae bacterium]
MGVFLKKHAYILCIVIFATIVAAGGAGIIARFRGNPVINEVCTSNVSCCEDANGQFPDWIELYNPTDADIDLSGYIVNKSSELKKEKFIIPEGTILSPGSFYLFDPGFSMSSEGSGVNLLDRDKHYIDHVDVPRLKYDTTYSRISDGAIGWEIKSPTPGYSNTEGEPLQPVIEGGVRMSEEPGFYGSDIDVKLKATNWGRKIYYTTDGSDPRTNGILYEGPIHISDRTSEDNVYSAIKEVSESYMSGESSVPSYKVDKCTVIAAVASDWLGRYTDVTYGSYFVGYDKKSAYDGITVVSASADPDDLFSHDDGILVLGNDYDEFVEAGMPDEYDGSNANFTRRGRRSEREINLEIFDEERRNVLDTRVGVRIKGLSSRWDVQKSFNLTFRMAYSGDDRAEFSTGGKDYDRHSLSLDKCGQDTATKMCDILMERCMSGTDCVTNDGVPCCLFLNGEYWGFYWLMDRIDESYIADEYGVNEEDVEIVDSEDFEPLGLNWEIENFDRDALIDYYAANIIVAHDGDWPGFNVRMWKTGSDEGVPFGDGRLRPVIFDMNSRSMQSPDYDVTEYLMEWYPFINVSEDPEFRTDLVARIDEMCADEFETDKMLAMIDGLYDEMKDQMILDKMRYTDCSADEAKARFDESVDVLRRFFEKRQDYLKGYNEKYLAAD